MSAGESCERLRGMVNVWDDSTVQALPPSWGQVGPADGVRLERALSLAPAKNGASRFFRIVATYSDNLSPGSWLMKLERVEPRSELLRYAMPGTWSGTTLYRTRRSPWFSESILASGTLQFFAQLRPRPLGSRLHIKSIDVEVLDRFTPPMLTVAGGSGSVHVQGGIAAAGLELTGDASASGSMAVGGDVSVGGSISASSLSGSGLALSHVVHGLSTSVRSARFTGLAGTVSCDVSEVLVSGGGECDGAQLVSSRPEVSPVDGSSVWSITCSAYGASSVHALCLKVV